MITDLVVGKYYRWVGPKDFNDDWTPAMDAIKNGKPFKCISCARFEGIEGGWSWRHVFKYLEEVKDVKEAGNFKVGDRVRINKTCLRGYEHRGKRGVVASWEGGNYFIHYDDSEDRVKHELSCLERIEEEKKMADVHPQVGDTVQIFGVMESTKHHPGDCGVVKELRDSYAKVEVNGVVGKYLWHEMKIVKRKEGGESDEEVKVTFVSMKDIRRVVSRSINYSE